jgi:hypothetical protein
MQYFEKQSKNKKEAEILEKQIIFQISNSSDRAKILIPKTRDFWFINEKYRDVFKIIKESVISGEDFLARMVKEEKATVYMECTKSGFLATGDVEKLPEQLKDIWLRYTLQDLVQKNGEKIIKYPHK